MLKRIAGLMLISALGLAPGAAQEPAAEAAPTISAEDQKQITRLETRIRGLLNRVQAIDEELAKLPKDPPGVVQPGVGVVEPGVAPPEGGAPMIGPDGMPMEGGEGAVPVAMTRRQRLEQEKGNALQEIFKLREELKILKEGDKHNPLEADNVPELHPTILYGGKLTANPFGLQIGSWGSGSIEEADQGMLEGLKSLLVYTDGYYRGVKFDFATSPELSKYFADPKRAYLELDIVFFPEKQEVAATGGEGSMDEGMSSEMMPEAGMEGAPAMSDVISQEPGMVNPEMAPPGGFSGGPGVAPPGMFPGDDASMMPGEGGMVGPDGMPIDGGMGMPAATAAKPAPPATRSLRVVLDTDRGPAVAEDVWFDHLYQVYPGWTRVFIPLTDFQRAEERAPEKLNRIRLFGDTTDAFYVGQVRLISDEVPIRPNIVGAPRITAVAGEDFKFETFADAGLSVLNYTWDFGDGETAESTDATVEHIYVKPGEYTVTLTATDADGLKEPGKTTATVVVQAFRELPRNRPMPGAEMPVP